jgi:hypothetical protein
LSTNKNGIAQTFALLPPSIAGHKDSPSSINPGIYVYVIVTILDMSAAQPAYTTAQPSLSDFTYVCVQPMAQSLPVDTTQLAYGQQCPSYYYSVETADFYGSDYQPNYVSTTAASNTLLSTAASQAIVSQPVATNTNVVAYEPQIDVVSAKSVAPTSEFAAYANVVATNQTVSLIGTPPASSDYSSPGCSTSPSSTASISSASSSAAIAGAQLPPEIRVKVFCPPSALNPSGHQRTPRRNKFELSAKRVHHCTEPGKL